MSHFMPIILLASLAGVAAESNTGVIRVLSYNIRFDNPRDGVNVWSGRKDDVARLIGPTHRADIAGLQEALHNQIIDLQRRLPGYAWFGAGRDDGKLRGEFSCLFYRTDRFELLDHGDFWLSETPDVPGSRSWDAAITRLCSWGRLKDQQTGVELFVFNTHFDHEGRRAREQSARIIRRKIASLAGEAPVIFTGDINALENSPPYNVLVGRTPVEGPVAILRDTRYLAGRAYDGPSGTFTRANWTLPSERGPIDYIFVGPGLEVLSYAVPEDRRVDGHYPSDHLPVLAEIRYRGR
jgi:endonuclease/exonuclease/phosphatase family metal-dependent hydrolase